MTRRMKALLIVGLLLALAVAGAIWFSANRAQNTPSSNARFVAAKEGTMTVKTHVQLPQSSVSGNSGTHRPETEIRYKPAAPADVRGKE